MRRLQGKEQFHGLNQFFQNANPLGYRNLEGEHNVEELEALVPEIFSDDVSNVEPLLCQELGLASNAIMVIDNPRWFIPQNPTEDDLSSFCGTLYEEDDEEYEKRTLGLSPFDPEVETEEEYEKREEDAWDRAIDEPEHEGNFFLIPPDEMEEIQREDEEDDTASDDNNELEVEEVWRSRKCTVSCNSTNANRRGRKKEILNRDTWETTTIVFIAGQHCHGGNDTRRLRRNDETGKMLGGNHRRPYTDTILEDCLTRIIVANRVYHL
ncbi:hypothetical protein ACFL29_02435 [Patescibacteria group bacterium]